MQEPTLLLNAQKKNIGFPVISTLTPMFFFYLAPTPKGRGVGSKIYMLKALDCKPIAF